MSSAVPVTVLDALLLSAVGCGGSESTVGQSSPAPTIADAVDETVAAATARFTMTLEHTRDDPTLGRDKGETESLDGRVDFDRHRTTSGRQDQVIVDETAFYLQPAAEGDLRWRKYDLSPSRGDELPPDLTFGRLDVIRQVQYVDSIAGTFERRGEEAVRGETTTRYQGYGEAEALMRTLLSESVFPLVPWSTHSATVERSLPVLFDVWVGEDGRVHKITYDFPSFSSYVGDLTTIELYDFGADVEIDLPAESEIVEG